MKNSHDEEMIDALKNRLASYQEIPDDAMWNSIAAGLPQQEGAAWKWYERGSILLVLLLLGGMYWRIDELTQHDHVGESKATISLSKSIENDQHQREARPAEGGVPTEPLRERPAISLNENQQGLRWSAPVEGKRDAARSERIMSGTTNIEKPSVQDDVMTRDEWLPIAIGRDSLLDGSKTMLRSQNIIVSDRDSGKKEIDSVAVETGKKERDRKKKLPKELQEPKKRRRSEFYFTAMPSLAFHKIVPIANDGTTITAVKSDGIFDMSRLGINLEVGYQRRLGERLEFNAGVSYYQQNQRIHYSYQNINDVTFVGVGNQQYEVKPTTREKDVDYAMRNVGVSMAVYYRIKEGKLQHKIGGGLQWQNGLRKAVGDGSYDNSRSYYLNYQISYRMEAEVNERLNIFLLPNITHVLYRHEQLTTPFAIRPFRAGIGIGVIYRM